MRKIMMAMALLGLFIGSGMSLSLPAHATTTLVWEGISDDLLWDICTAAAPGLSVELGRTVTAPELLEGYSDATVQVKYLGSSGGWTNWEVKYAGGWVMVVLETD